jgi:hypothetical protein
MKYCDNEWPREVVVTVLIGFPDHDPRECDLCDKHFERLAGPLMVAKQARDD